MVGGYLRSAQVKSDGGLSEGGLNLLASLPSGRRASGLQCATNHPNGTGDMIGLEAGVFLSHPIINKVVQRVVGKHLLLPGYGADVVQQL